MSRELHMCVVKAFSMTKTCSDHRKSTKDLAIPRRSGEETKARNSGLHPNRLHPNLLHPDALTWTAPIFLGPLPSQTTRQLTPTHPGGTRAGARVGRKSFFLSVVYGKFFFLRVDISFFEVGPAIATVRKKNQRTTQSCDRNKRRERKKQDKKTTQDNKTLQHNRKHRNTKHSEPK